jgi:C4-type Zn-finger protein
MPNDDELANQIRNAFDAGKEITVIVQKAMGQEAIVQMK